MVNSKYLPDELGLPKVRWVGGQHGMRARCNVFFFSNCSDHLGKRLDYYSARRCSAVGCKMLPGTRFGVDDLRFFPSIVLTF
jgi:hypothetical protein